MPENITLGHAWSYRCVNYNVSNIASSCPSQKFPYWTHILAIYETVICILNKATRSPEISCQQVQKPTPQFFSRSTIWGNHLPLTFIFKFPISTIGETTSHLTRIIFFLEMLETLPPPPHIWDKKSEQGNRGYIHPCYHYYMSLYITISCRKIALCFSYLLIVCQ